MSNEAIDAGRHNPEDSQKLPVSRGAEATPALYREGYGYGYGPPPLPSEGDLAASFLHYVRIALKRRWLILSVIAAVVVIGTLKALMTTPRYAATVRIQIDREAAKVFESNSSTQQEENTADFLRTQFELLRSRAMAERVVSQLHLYEDADFLKTRKQSLIASLVKPFRAPRNETPGELQAQAVKAINSEVDVKPVAGSRLVDITFMDTDPTRAQLIANAYADAYVDSTVDKRFQANSYAKTFLNDQIKQLKIRLEASEKAALDFAESEKIVEVNDKASVAENNLAAANAAVGQLISERIRNEQLWRQVEGATAINLPQLLSNRVIDELRSQKKALETEYQEKLESFKPGYPAMIQISNKIREIDKQLAAEVNTIKNSLKAAYDAALNQENEMKNRVEELRENLLALQKKSIQYNILKRDVETNRGLYNNLLQRSKEVEIAGGSAQTNVFIIDRAVIPDAPSEPNIPRALALSLAIGIILAFGLAYLLEIFDSRIRGPEDFEQLAGLSVLGVIPLVPGDQVQDEMTDPRSHVSEAFRSLATALQFSTEAGLPRSIAVTSAGPSEGKSTTALAISRHFSLLGLKVLLVDGDLRNPSLHRKLSLNNAMGLSNYLTGQALPPELVQKTESPNLAFMASGPLPPNAADLLGGSRVVSLVSVGAEIFDLIVIDCPPVAGLADAQLLANATAATIFVVGAGQYRKGIIRAALRQLALARVALIGAVLTKFDVKNTAYGYGYGYGYTYNYGYGVGARKTPEAISNNERPGELTAASQGGA